MDKRKKVQVWLSPIEFKALSDYCERNGVSFYSVLKEGIAHVIGEESPIPITTSKQDAGSSMPAPSPQISLQLQQKYEHRFANLEKAVDTITGYDQLWREVSDLKAKVGELSGLVSGLLLKLTKTEELEDKFDKKIEDTVVGVLENLVSGRIKEMV